MNRFITILLRAQHDSGFKKLSDFIVVIKHRGAPGDRKEINGSEITDVKKNGFYLIDTFIPAHRIIELKEKS
jgi:uncharacterized protein (UPF0248 family)